MVESLARPIFVHDGGISDDSVMRASGAGKAQVDANKATRIVILDTIVSVYLVDNLAAFPSQPTIRHQMIYSSTSMWAPDLL